MVEVKEPQSRAFMYIHAHTRALKPCKSMDIHLKVEKEKSVRTNCLRENMPLSLSLFLKLRNTPADCIALLDDSSSTQKCSVWEDVQLVHTWTVCSQL